VTFRKSAFVKIIEEFHLLVHKRDPWRAHVHFADLALRLAPVFPEPGAAQDGHEWPDQEHQYWEPATAAGREEQPREP
jgi:hypothetical protein